MGIIRKINQFALTLRNKAHKKWLASKTFCKILKISGVAALIGLLLLTAFTALGVVLADENQMSPWGTVFFFVNSGSMDPAIPVGSLIFVKSIKEEDISENDIITFYSANGRDIVTHRVREVDYSENGHVYTTRGDSNNADDPPLSYDRVIGQAYLLIPGANFVVRWFNDLRLIGGFIIGLGVILVIYGLIRALIINRNEQDNTH